MYIPNEKEIGVLEALISKMRKIIRGEDESIRHVSVSMENNYESNPVGKPIFVEQDITITIGQYLGAKIKQHKEDSEK